MHVQAMLCGAIVTLCLIAALFFLRFWRSSGDRFFPWFALSFGIESVNRVVMGLHQSWNEDAPSHYLVRLASYVFILLAIWGKNRKRG